MVKKEFSSNAYRGEAMNLRGSFFLGLILIFGTFLSAQVQELGAPIISNYEPEQYKAHYQNWVAMQDRRGVMYFGNTLGILEFDGQRWQLIPTPGNVVTRALVSGPDGTIYYGSNGDLGYLAVSPTGKISAVSLRDIIPEAERSFNDVWRLESCVDGIYFLTRSSIFRFHGGKITALPGKFAYSQACVLNGTLFYADMDKGLCMLKGDQVVPIPRLGGVYNGKRITLAPFGRHQLLVGRVTGDFLCIDLSAFWDEVSYHYDVSRQAPNDIVKPFPSELDDFIKESNGFLYKLIPIGSDAFAIATLKGGIVTFDRTGKIIRAINKDGGLLDNSVHGLLVDRSNNLWATTNAGISHIELSVPQSVFGARNGIDGASLTVCFHNGRLYMGTFQNLLIQAPYHFTRKDDVPKFVALKNSPSINTVWQFLETEGDLMAATGSGLFRIQGEAAFKVPGSSTYGLCLGTSRRWPGHLFVGLSGGLEVFKRISGKWILVGRMDGIKENIRCITEDADGDLWLSTGVKGLLRAHFSGGKPTEVAVHPFGPEQGLPGLTSLRTSFYGKTLYARTPKGLFRANIQPWNAEGPDRTRFAPDLALGKAFSDPPTAIYDMASDGKGGFIFSTSEKVVWAVPGKNRQFQMITRPFQGLPSPDESVYVHPNGSVWLPGKVLHRVDPWVSKNYDQPFEVLIRKVIAKTKRLVFEGTHDREGAAIRSQRTVFHSAQGNGEIPELPYNQNALYFEFSASFYEKPGTTQFQYLLEGFDKDWSDWGTVAFKEYTSIPEDSYRFRVRAKNLYGTMGREAVFRFRILPPWYRTWWAYVMWIIVTSVALVGIIYLYTWKLRRQKDLLKRLVAKRTQALAEANDYLKNLFDYANAPIIVWDPQFRITSFNHAFETLTGRTSAEVLGKRLEILFPPEQSEASMELIQLKLSDERREVVELNIQHMDGSLRTVLWNSATLLSADGKIPIATISQIQDITGRKIAEEKIKNLLAEKELILKEVHHRIKNNMATVKGLFSLQADTLKNPEAVAALKDASGRVQSMVVLYEKLYQSIGFDKVAASNYLTSLVDEIVANFPDSAKVKVDKKIADFVLNAKKLQPLGIIINELLTNIMKYAFTGRSDGLITVSVELKGNRVSLAIQDNGKGMPDTVDFENSTGFGLRLVSILTKQLAGTIRIEHGNGTRVILEFEK